MPYSILQHGGFVEVRTPNFDSLCLPVYLIYSYISQHLSEILFQAILLIIYND